MCFAEKYLPSPYDGEEIVVKPFAGFVFYIIRDAPEGLSDASRYGGYRVAVAADGDSLPNSVLKAVTFEKRDNRLRDRALARQVESV